MSSITTHVLDLSRGRPACDLEVTLTFCPERGERRTIAVQRTDEQGRVSDFESSPLEIGVYRLRFTTGDYFESLGESPFHPYAEITFTVRDPDQHYHVPLLVSGHSFTTYRGS